MASQPSDAWIRAAGGSQRVEQLIRKTADAVARGPIFDGIADVGAAPGKYPYRRGRLGTRASFQPWDALSSIRHSDPATLNRRALEELAAGAHGIAFTLPGSIDTQALKTILDAIDTEIAPVHFCEVRDANGLASALLEASPPSTARLHCSFDPVSHALATGVTDWQGQMERHRDFTQKVASRLPHLRTGRISSLLIHDAGGSEVQELAFCLAALQLHLETASDPTSDVVHRLDLETVASPDTHLTIAKLRALRVLVAHVLSAWGVAEEDAALPLAVRNSRRDMQARDAWNNILRLTAAATGAALGGADAIRLDSLAGNAHQCAFTRRVSRNIQIVLRDEAGLGRVIDPAGGSGLHEHLTQSLIDESWALFQNIVGEGGLANGRARERFAVQVQAQRVALERRIATGRETLLGVNAFVDRDPRAVPAERDSHDDGLTIAPHAVAHGPDAERNTSAEWCAIRLAAPFEEMQVKGTKRDAAILTLGSQKEHGARTQWVRNRLAAGGIQVIELNAGDPLPDRIGLAILSGSDEASAEWLSSGQWTSQTPFWVAGDLAGQSASEAPSRYIHRKTSLMDDLQIAHKILEGGV